MARLFCCLCDEGPKKYGGPVGEGNLRRHSGHGRFYPFGTKYTQQWLFVSPRIVRKPMVQFIHLYFYFFLVKFEFGTIYTLRSDFKKTVWYNLYT